MLRRVKDGVRNFIKNAAREAIEEALQDDAYNMERQLQRGAMVQSSRYILDNIELSKGCGDRYSLMKQCLSFLQPSGLILEFGVYKGNSIRFLAEQLPGRSIFGFDSFEGLKEPWVFTPPGAFSELKELPQVPQNVTLIKGFFDQTLPGFLDSHPGPIALLHIDSDLYSSCSYVLGQVTTRLVPGSILVFDELLNYPNWESGEFKAFNEWRESRKVTTEYLGFVGRRGVDWSGHQVAIRIAEQP